MTHRLTFPCWVRRMRGERESGHKGTREVGNVDPDTEITFQFGANDQSTQGEDIKSLAHLELSTLFLLFFTITSWTLIQIKSYQQPPDGLL